MAYCEVVEREMFQWSFVGCASPAPRLDLSFFTLNWGERNLLSEMCSRVVLACKEGFYSGFLRLARMAW